eukprot:scaffold229254_cov51-Attheya_sp.AAC.1
MATEIPKLYLVTLLKRLTAVLNMQTRIKELGLKAPAAPTVPKAGCMEAATSGKNFPPTAYAPPKYRIPMATAVYIMPIMPTSENGARLLKFFKRQRGSKTNPVTPIMAFEREVATPQVASSRLKVSPKIML